MIARVPTLESQRFREALGHLPTGVAAAEDDRFDGIEWHRGACGPCLDVAPAAEPLVFHRGRYAAIA